jgi:hypothetical protein
MHIISCHMNFRDYPTSKEHFSLKWSFVGKLSKLLVTVPFSINYRSQIENLVSDYTTSSSELLLLNIKKQFFFKAIVYAKIYNLISVYI